MYIVYYSVLCQHKDSHYKNLANTTLSIIKCANNENDKLSKTHQQQKLNMFLKILNVNCKEITKSDFWLVDLLQKKCQYF